jgi:hypothetical protein
MTVPLARRAVAKLAVAVFDIHDIGLRPFVLGVAVGRYVADDRGGDLRH